ncbi:MAG TPA: hypothetical protein VHP31_11825 [Caproicibacter sp.]|nr:hypothetical protein [Caproicibacter sp.]
MKKKAKEPFEYEYTQPSLDWYETVQVKIKPDDYYYFRLERRFGPSWWLIGEKPKNEPDYHWEEKEIGEIGERDLLRFIEWAKDEWGSKIIEVHAISGSFDILEEIKELVSK